MDPSSRVINNSWFSESTLIKGKVSEIGLSESIYRQKSLRNLSNKKMVFFLKLENDSNKYSYSIKKYLITQKIKKGDYLRLHFLAYNQKRRGGDNFRMNQQTVLLQKKKRKKNSLSFLVTSLYQKEVVKWRYLISSPHMVKVIFLKKSEKI